MSTETEQQTGSVPEPRLRLRSAGLPAHLVRAATAPVALLGKGPVDGARLKRALAVRFRLPGRGDPAPDQRRLAIVCGWAAALGFGGTIVALRLLVNLFQQQGGWYRPTATAIGTVGVLVTVGAFASIHRRRLPWLLLTAGTGALLLALFLTAA
jgi:hypothetical protein